MIGGWTTGDRIIEGTMTGEIETMMIVGQILAPQLSVRQISEYRITDPRK